VEKEKEKEKEGGGGPLDSVAFFSPLSGMLIYCFNGNLFMNLRIMLPFLGNSR